MTTSDDTLETIRKATKLRSALRTEAQTLGETPVSPFSGEAVLRQISALYAAADGLSDEAAAHLHDLIMAGDR